LSPPTLLSLSLAKRSQPYFFFGKYSKKKNRKNKKKMRKKKEKKFFFFSNKNKEKRTMTTAPRHYRKKYTTMADEYITRSTKKTPNPVALEPHTWDYSPDSYSMHDLKKRFVARGLKDAEGKRRSLKSLITPGRMIPAKQAKSPNRQQIVNALIEADQHFGPENWVDPDYVPKAPKQDVSGLQTYKQYASRLKGGSRANKKAGYALRDAAAALAAGLPQGYYRMPKGGVAAAAEQAVQMQVAANAMQAAANAAAAQVVAQEAAEEDY
jgi:hypothetical protein